MQLRSAKASMPALPGRPLSAVALSPSGVRHWSCPVANGTAVTEPRLGRKHSRSTDVVRASKVHYLGASLAHCSSYNCPGLRFISHCAICTEWGRTGLGNFQIREWNGHLKVWRCMQRSAGVDLSPRLTHVPPVDLAGMPEQEALCEVTAFHAQHLELGAGLDAFR